MTLHRWRLFLWAAMLLLVAWLVWQARGTLIPFAFGAILAYAFTPVVDLLARAIPARSHRADVYRRGMIVLLVYLVIAGVFVGISLFLVPLAVEQIAQFADQMPDLADRARQQVEDWLNEYRANVPVDIQNRVDPLIEDWTNAAAAAAAGWLRTSVSFITETLTILIGLLVLPFWMFYALRDRHFFSRNFMNAVPPGIRRDIENLLAIADQLLARYIRGQLFLGVVVGTAVGIGLTVLGVQLSLVLGVWAGVTELIPILGPWLGAIPALIIVLATDPSLFLWVVLLYVAVQQLENNLLVPRVQGQAVDLHPAMIILLLAIAGSVFGFIGLLFIVPLTAILREVFWYLDRRLRGLEPPEALAASYVLRKAPRPHEDVEPAQPAPAPEVVTAGNVRPPESPPSDPARTGR